MYDLTDVKSYEFYFELRVLDSGAGSRGKLAWAISRAKLKELKRRLQLLLIVAMTVLLIVLGIDSPTTLDLVRTLLSAILSQMGG